MNVVPSSLMSALPDDVHSFLYQRITSVEQLEDLLIARRSPGRSWSGGDMARELFSHPSSIAERLRVLLGAG